MPNMMRSAEERFFAAADGTRLFYRYWPAIGARAAQAVILFHRGHEHSGRLQHVVDELDLPAIAMFAIFSVSLAQRAGA
jgi:alpha-beta hydrolase superfamily lysophospholipase